MSGIRLGYFGHAARYRQLPRMLLLPCNQLFQPSRSLDWYLVCNPHGGGDERHNLCRTGVLRSAHLSAEQQIQGSGGRHGPSPCGGTRSRYLCGDRRIHKISVHVSDNVDAHRIDGSGCCVGGRSVSREHARCHPPSHPHGIQEDGLLAQCAHRLHRQHLCPYQRDQCPCPRFPDRVPDQHDLLWDPHPGNEILHHRGPGGTELAQVAPGRVQSGRRLIRPLQHTLHRRGKRERDRSNPGAGSIDAAGLQTLCDFGWRRHPDRTPLNRGRLVRIHGKNGPRYLWSRALAASVAKSTPYRKLRVQSVNK